MTRSTRLQAKAQAMYESDGSDLTDIEDVEAAADNTVDCTEDAFNDAFDDSGLLSPEEKSDSEEEYFAPGYKRSKAAKKLKKDDDDAYIDSGEGSVKKRARRSKLVWTVDAPFDHLSDEVTAMIFSHLGNEKRRKDVTSFIQVSRHFLRIVDTASARAMWLFETYGRDSALYEAVNMGWICDAKTLDYLIDVLGARASRYFFQIITLAYLRRAPTWVGRSYGTPEMIPFTCWLAVLKKGLALYPQITPTKGKTDNEIFLTWIDSLGTTAAIPKKPRRRPRKYFWDYGYRGWRLGDKPSNVVTFDNDHQADLVKQQEFKIIESLFVDYQFAPFNQRDPINMETFAKALMINSDFLELAMRSGFTVTKEFSEEVYRIVSVYEKWTAEDKINQLAELYALYPELKPEAEYFSHRLLPSIQDRDQIGLLALLDADEDRVLDFLIGDLIPDFLQYLRDRPEPARYEVDALSFGALELLKQFPPEDLKADLHFACAKVCLSAARLDQNAQKPTKKVKGTPSLQSTALSDVITFMEGLQLDLGFDDLLELVLTLDEEKKSPVVLQFLEQTVENWQEIVTVTAGSLLWSPTKGKQLLRLIEAVPSAKDFVKQILLSDFQLDAEKLANSRQSTWGYTRWDSPFIRPDATGYSHSRQTYRHEIYAKPSVDALDLRLSRKDRFSDPSRYPYVANKDTVGFVVNDMFANDREIQAQIVLNSVLQQKSSKGKVAISLELFDLFAAIEIEPPDALFEATLKAPYFRTHAEAVASLPSQGEHVEQWIRGFEQVLVRKVDWLEQNPPRYRQIPMENEFVLTLVEWKQAFEGLLG